MQVLAGILLAVILFSNITYAQEVEMDLLVNPQLIKSTQPSILWKNGDSRAFFVTDTIGLPFLDDFSSDKRKKYDYTSYDSKLLKDSAVFNLTYNGMTFPMDTNLGVMIDTSYTYTIDTISKKIDSSLNMPVTVVRYTNEDNPFLPVDTQVFWPTTQKFDTSGGTIDTVDVAADLTLEFTWDTIKYVSDDSTLWLNSEVFVNNNFPIDPITIGVATFDGVDSLGQPYDFSSPTSYGVADQLTSKPIDLSTYNPGDSLYLSFYFQPEGHGNAPEDEDSLVLEFKTPDSSWVHVWSVEGSPLHDFKLVMIPVIEQKYFAKGFQFRFTNYSTLSGSFDHWNIDYVYLDENRSMNDTIFKDVAFVYPVGSFLQGFESVPFSHYVKSQMKSRVDVIITNRDEQARNIRYGYEVNEVNGGFSDSYDGGSFNINPFVTNGYHDYTPHRNPVVNFEYPLLSANKEFEIRHILNTSGDLIRTNDTISYRQQFKNYYAYDDGSAESGYGLEANQAQLAYRFTTTIADTIRAVQMYFNPLRDDVTTELFNLTIWEGGSTPGKVIYQKLTQRPVFTDSLNKFHTYLIDDTTLVLNGTFYVGWVQLNSVKLNLGLDKNRVSNDKLFYNTTGSWVKSGIQGSVMIRPVFGSSLLAVGVEEALIDKPEFQIYPNPVLNDLKIKPPYELSHQLYIAEVYDIYGKLVIREQYYGYSSINVTGLNAGLYLIKISIDVAEQTYSGKFFKQ